ncbi:MAG: nitrite reductase (NAD(P)H) small subunit [Ignavibacteriae bacterium]|nr:nitrite reductase (NAD(P)H) small subunit [Ignavibacteriota bacterium]
MINELEEYTYVCNYSELKDSIGKRFYIKDVDIAIFKVNNKIFAVSNICPHQHASNIYEGFVENECVVCPLHGWTFRLEDGNLTGGSRGLESYKTKIIDDKIYVKIIQKKLNW